MANRAYSPPTAYSAAAIVVSSLVLLGWLLNIELFKGIVPGLPGMNPVTAACFILAGLALAVLPDPTANAAVYRWARVGAAAVAVVGLLRLSSLVTGLDTGIDRVLFASKLGVEGAVGSPGMSTNSAASFILLGAALLLLSVGPARDRSLAGWAALAAAGGPALALVAYAYGAFQTDDAVSQIPMSLLTAATFLILVAGVLSAQTRRGALAFFTDAAHAVTARRGLLAALIAPPAIGGLWLAGYRAGLYDVELGMAVLVVATMALIIVAFARSAAQRAAGHQQRTASEARADAKGDQLQVVNTLLAELASQDPLTGLHNRRSLQSRLEKEIRRVVRYPEAVLSLIILDIDHFKLYNDTYGHPAGDCVLQLAAQYLLAAKRDTDFVARYGGEEFAIILPHTDLDGAVAVAERLRAGLADGPWPDRPITASFGVATSHSGPNSAQALLSAADHALYDAKSAGRNCVSHAAQSSINIT